MKRLLPMLLFTVFIVQFASAQLPNGTKAPNFTITDLGGNSHELYNLMGQDKVVFVDFFATWCGSCWNYHQTHALEDINQLYGPNGSNQARVFAIEADPATSVQCITASAGCSGGTIGNWTSGVTYPTADDAGVANLYQINAYPRILFFCPEDTTVYSIGQATAAAAWATAQNLCNTLPQPPAVGITSITNVPCKGSSTGAIDLTIGGNNAPFTFLWSNGATTEDLVGVPAGTYSVTVTGASGLTSVVPIITILEPTLAFTASVIFSQNPTCNGILGSAFVNASGGTSGYSYLWSNGQTSSQATNLTGGTYTCTATDGNGCTAVTSVTLNAAGAPTAAAVASNALTCVQNTAQISATGSSTGTNITYAWQAGAGGNIVGSASGFGVTVDQAGVYTVIVTNTTSNCTSTASVTVSENTAIPALSIASANPLTCANTSTILQGNGPTGSQYSVFWISTNGNIASGEMTYTPTVNAPGLYILNVIDSNTGCTASQSVTITGNTTPPALSISTPAVLDCQTTQIQLQGNGPTGAQYTTTWSSVNGSIISGGSTYTPIVNAAGIYTLTVLDNNSGCSSTSSITVTGNSALPTLSIAPAAALGCQTSQIQLQGSGSSGNNFSYLWTTTDGMIVSGANTLTPTVNQAGTYQLAITNTTSNCVNTATIQVNSTPPLVFSGTTVQNVLCNGMSTGSAMAPASGGVGLINYIWSNGATSSSISNLSAGTYIVTATDTEGCTATNSLSVTEPSAIQLTTSATSISSVGNTDGTATASATGGTGTFSFLWSNGATTSSITNLAPGSYSVTATDANNCVQSQTVVVNSINCSLSSTVASQNISCNGMANGTAMITVQNAAQPLVYLWSNGATSASIANLAPGSYTCNYTDADGCAGSGTVQISQPTAISAQITSQTNVQCSDDATGTATIGASGGTGTLTYTWSNGAMGSTASNLLAGSYSVVISDANACTTTLANITIAANDTEQPVLAAHQNVVIALSTTGSVQLTPSILGIQATDNCGTVSVDFSPTTFDCSHVGPNLVDIIATDANGNTTMVSTTVEIEDKIAPVIQCPTSIVRCASDALVQFTAPTVFDNCVQQTVTQQTSGLASGAIFPVGETIQRFIVEDAGGNTDECSFTVTVNSALDIQSVLTDVSCASECDGAATFVVMGGMAPYSYSSPNPTGLCAGTYGLTVTDGMGCSTVENFTITEPLPVAIQLVSSTNDIGNAGLGAISVTATGGVAPFIYTWTDAHNNTYTGATITGLFMGIYTVTAMDANGCAITLPPVVVENTVSEQEPSWMQAVTVSPNPTSGLVYLNFGEKPNSDLDIQILDLTGKLLQSQHSKANQVISLDLTAYAAGMYLIRVSTSDGSGVRRIVIE